MEEIHTRLIKTEIVWTLSSLINSETPKSGIFHPDFHPKIGHHNIYTAIWRQNHTRYRFFVMILGELS